MTTPGEFIKTLADALRVPEATVAVHDRNLRSAGLRSKSGRGRGAAKVTARDAAHLLVAVLGSEQVKDSADAVRRYAKTKAERSGSDANAIDAMGITELAALPAEHSFIDAVEALIIAAMSGSLAKWRHASERSVPSGADPLIELAAHAPGTVADIRIADIKHGQTASLHYVLPERAAKRGGKTGGIAGLQQYRFVLSNTIWRIAAALVSESS